MREHDESNVNCVRATFALACSSSAATEPAKTFKDSQNRTCTADGRIATCDVAPAPKAGCSAPAAACFVVDNLERAQIESPAPGEDAGAEVPVRNCAGCCTGDKRSMTSGYDVAECVSIICSVDVDCPGSESKCASGNCVRPR